MSDVDRCIDRERLFAEAHSDAVDAWIEDNQSELELEYVELLRKDDPETFGDLAVSSVRGSKCFRDWADRQAEQRME